MNIPHDENLEDLKKDFGTPTHKLQAITFDELLHRDCKPREYILNPVLPSQSINMIHAYRGVGKTFFALGIACAVASGGAFFGWQASKPRGVMYIDGEMPLHALKERITNINASLAKEITVPLIFLTPDLQEFGMPNLATEQGQAEIETLITPEIELIIVDNLSTLARSGKENEGESWLPIQEWALRLRAKGKSVLFIHHSNKSGGQRGTSRREDVLDTVICLKRPPDYIPESGALFEVNFEKARHLYGEEVAPFVAQLSTDANGKQHWVSTSLDLSNYDKIVSLYNDGLSQIDIAEELNINKSTVSRNIKKAEQAGLIKPKKTGSKI